jgi:hypothetical protein
MNKRKSSPRQDDLDAKAIEAALDAQSLPPGPERTEALRKAEKLRNVADYNYSFFQRTQAARIIKFTFVLKAGTKSRFPRDLFGWGQIAWDVQCPADRSTGNRRTQWPVSISALQLPA